MVSLVDARFTNTDFLTEFIRLYKVNTCLWQVKSTDYSNRDKRASAYQSLVDLCIKVNPKCDVNFVKKKIANLRNAFRKEHAKVESSKKSGAGANDIYMPKLWYYKLLEFTADHEEPLESFCSIDDAVQDTQSTEDYARTSESDVEDKVSKVFSLLKCFIQCAKEITLGLNFKQMLGHGHRYFMQNYFARIQLRCC
ncbi:UNVERIFIED_CONTAM: hypothetical protein GTU68_062387 [Idotea baltica]|nr:hypothetical protein [Idotea baltica]